MIDELGLDDIKFLRAVRDINANPDEYEGTDQGEVPANTRSIRLATDLSRSMVNYRLASSNSRGLDESDMGLIRVYPAQIEGNSFGPKSTELTEKGVRVLSEIEESGLMGSGPDPSDESETVKQLRARIETLENQGVGEGGEGVPPSELSDLKQRVDEFESQLDSLRSDVNALEETITRSEWGSMDEEIAEDLARVRRLSPALMYAFQELLGIDVQWLVDNSSQLNEDVKAEMRRDAFEKLQAAAESADSDGETDPGHSDEFTIPSEIDG